MKTMAEIKRDSARWDALMRSARIRILGTAGLGELPYQHFGMEIWSSYGIYDDIAEKSYGVKVFETYADTIIRGTDK